MRIRRKSGHRIPARAAGIAAACALLLAAGASRSTSSPPSLATASVTGGFAGLETETGTGSLRLTFQDHTYEQVRRAARVLWSAFPLPAGQSVDLELERFFVTTPATRIVLVTADGEKTVPTPDIVQLRGHVAGVPGSRAVLSVSAHRVYGVIVLPDPQAGKHDDGTEGSGSDARPANGTTYVVVPEAQSAGGGGIAGGAGLVHSVVSADDVERLAPPALWGCQVESEPAPRPPAWEIEQQQQSATFRICRLAMECDYEFWTYFTSLDEALANIYAVTTAVSAINERDVSVQLVLPFIRIWTTSADPYSYVGGEITGLHEFEDYWRTHHNPGQAEFVERDLAHLRSGRGVGAWGEVGHLCDYTYGFSISGGQARPGAAGFLHDVIFVGHELGHNFNAIHTHCFDPPLDKCATEAGCNDVQDCNTAPSTIMSYCDNCPGGLANVMEQFAPENITRMLSHIGSSCLAPARNPCYVDAANTGSEDGTLSHPYDTVEEGTWYVLPGGTVSIAGGSYGETLTIFQPMTLTGRNSSVVIGP